MKSSKSSKKNKNLISWKTLQVCPLNMIFDVIYNSFDQALAQFSQLYCCDLKYREYFTQASSGLARTKESD